MRGHGAHNKRVVFDPPNHILDGEARSFDLDDAALDLQAVVGERGSGVFRFQPRDDRVRFPAVKVGVLQPGGENHLPARRFQILHKNSVVHMTKPVQLIGADGERSGKTIQSVRSVHNR